MSAWMDVVIFVGTLVVVPVVVFKYFASDLPDDFLSKLSERAKARKRGE